MTEITFRLSTALADRYRIERHLGEGGMANVYLAMDLKHDRQVAVKVLRPELAAVLGAERFVQEIKTTASLQHPHILPLFDSGEADGFLFYVMPYIEGETLRDKLNRESQLGIDEAVGIATAIADALDYAHRHNVIHRDIKPENLLLHDGRPMVADFGIALAVSAAAGGRMTETGLSLGTPHYMSPEQATAEKEISNRSDIYSLGSVLYEMLAGEPPHVGGTAQAIIMKIVTEPAPPVTNIRKTVPPHVAAATAQSLERLAADRFETAAKFAEALTNPTFTLPGTGAIGVAGANTADWRRRFSMPFAGLALLFFLTTMWGWLRPQPEVPRPVSQYSIAVPEEEALAQGRLSRLAISPDGSRLVYVGMGAQNGQLWVRRLDQLHATPLPGTESANAPFFSPDGSRVGFFAANTGVWQAASLNGGPPITIADSGIGPTGVGGAWGPDGYLYFDGDLPGNGLARVPENGGAPEAVTVVDSAQGEQGHAWPVPLPGGRGVVFSVRRGGQVNLNEWNIAVADLSTGTHTVLLRGVRAVYASSGHLVYVTADGTLMGVPFDENTLTLTGEAVALVGNVHVRGLAFLDLALSATGTLFYTTGRSSGGTTEVVWVTRDGTTEEIDPGWGGDFSWPTLSPDGRHLALTIAATSDQQIWIKELDRGPLPKLTFAGTANRRAAWAPDGRSVAFVSGNGDIHARSADGTGQAELLLGLDEELFEVTYSPDQEWVVFRTGTGNRDIYGRRGTDSVPVALMVTEFNEAQPTVSPDGRWLAYISNESGPYEVYVRPFPNTDDGRWLVSAGGGTEPVWAHSGRELFYRDPVNQMSVKVLPGPTFVMGERQTLFPVAQFRRDDVHQQYDVTSDDQRFVMIRLPGGDVTNELIVVENFFEELKERVGN